LNFCQACSLQPEEPDGGLSSNHGGGLVAMHHVIRLRKKVEGFIHHQLFTEYRYASEIKKPVLFTLKAFDGTIMTFGYPLQPRPGE